MSGDLWIIKNNKLRKLLAKGPSPREPWTTNFFKALIEITTTFDRSIETTKIISDPHVKKHTEELHQKFVIVTINKASNNFAFICRKYYISKLLAEVFQNQIKLSTATYSPTLKSKEKITKTNIKYCRMFFLKITDQGKTLPIMYWLPKMHKTPIGGRFIVALKDCSTKPLSGVISKVFKMIFNHVESFHRKSFFYICLKKFWVVQN